MVCLPKRCQHKVWLINIKIPQRFLVMDGNTVFNIDGRDVYYDDLEAVYMTMKQQQTKMIVLMIWELDL